LGTSPAPIPKAKLTVERLVAAITTAVADVNMRKQAKVIANEIQVEDGVKQAVAILHRFIVDYKTKQRVILNRYAR
jgi:UDP:flavonoid glycosyltransferase YjiC (YdhE family)